MARSAPITIGMAWYYRQDYRRILAFMEDADELPATYDQWLKGAEESERQLKREGHLVLRAIIDPDEFVAWCRARGLKLDAKARSQWASEFASRQASGLL